MSLDWWRALGRIFSAGAFSASILTASLLALPTTARAQQVVLVVDGEPITALDIEQRSKFLQLSTGKAPVRQDVVNALIDEILEIKEGKKFGIDVPQSEIDNQFASVATRMGLDVPKLTQMLEKAGASAPTLKQQLRAQLAWTALVRGRYKSSLEIPDSDVEAELALHKPQDASQVGYEYSLQPIVLIVPRGSPDTAFEARKKDADALRGRFDGCSTGIPFARALREVAVRDPIVKFSADLVPQLRDILDKTDVGHLTPPEQTAEGIQMFALCGKKENKTDTPATKEVRDQIFQQKFGARAKRYLAELRRGAMIEYK